MSDAASSNLAWPTIITRRKERIIDSREFFKTVFAEQQGNVVIVLPNYANKPTNDRWFNYPADLDKMVALVEENKHGDVWFSPILFDSVRRTKDNALTTNVLAADADACDPNNFRVRPSLSIETSPGHWHVYWVLDSALAAGTAAVINRRIAQVHKEQGCDTAFVNAAKLLRVPGTSNNKHPGAVVFAADIEDATYDVLAFEALYPAEEVPDAFNGESVVAPDDLAEYVTENRARLLSNLPNTIGLRDLIFTEPHQNKRSEQRYKLLCELVRLGLDDRETVAVAWGAPSNKYRDDPRSYAGLWAEATKARQDVAAEPHGIADEDLQEKKPELQRSTFLSEEEVALVRADINFIDQWIQWAGTKTDAPAEYHRAAAITLLSTVYSEFGHATPKFARDGLKLNLWFLVLGRSTKDRKSTARSYMNSALRSLRTEEYDYQLGDDVTPGGISLALHDRANKASVFDRDEVQGLFKEVLNQGYMAGGLEVFTKLYDGWSGGRVRASGDKKKLESVPVSFIMFMMGILSETADVLTITNYRSGFLTRFLYVIGRRPEGYKSPPIEQASEEEEEVDKVFNGLVNHLELNRNHWSMLGDEGKTTGVRMDDDAWKRFQQFEADVLQKAEDSSYAEIIETTANRMVISVLKLATLLAMDDRARTVKAIHVLQAISYAGEWFDNAEAVASMVSASEWERDVDQLEAYLNSRGGQCSLAQAYARFPGKRPKEFEEMLVALEQRGVMERHAQGNRWLLELKYKD
jgi:hypothetical protein